MANFSQAFGYKVYMVPILSPNVDLTDLDLAGVGTGGFIDPATVIASDATISSGYSGTPAVYGITAGTALALDGTDDPVVLVGLTEASLDTSTSEEEILTYDDTSQGFDQSVATSKAFSMKLSGVTDFRDAGYKLMRIIEKDVVRAGTMCKLARLGPTGTDECVFGFGRITNFSETNTVKSVVKWSATFKGYGPYELDLDTN